MNKVQTPLQLIAILLSFLTLPLQLFSIEIRTDVLDCKNMTQDSQNLDQGWSWKSQPKTLTLSSCDIRAGVNNSGGSVGLILPEGATLVLKRGSINQITSANIIGDQNKTIALTASDLTIKGQGVLNLIVGNVDGNASDNYGLLIEKNCTVQSSSVNATAGNISGTGGKSYGIYVDGIFTSSGTITAKSGIVLDNPKNTIGIGASKVVIKGGSIDAFSGDAAKNSDILSIYQIDNQHLIIAGNFNNLIQRQLKKEYGNHLLDCDKRYQAGNLKYWSYSFHYTFSYLNTTKDLHLAMFDAFQKPSSFLLTSNKSDSIPIAEQGYWVNAIGLGRVPTMFNTEKIVQAPDLIHFAYLKLSRPLYNGELVTLKTPFSNPQTWVYDHFQNVSRAIKVNQEGYHPLAEEKYAYIGFWLGTLGEFPAEKYEGDSFYICDNSTNQVKFTGAIKLRSKEQFTASSGGYGKLPLHGETVMELDFSKFNTLGEYYIFVPKVGRSFSFKIGTESIANAFYTQMRGLYHQRSGIAKAYPYTQWTLDTAQYQTYQATFPPNADHYKKASGCFYALKNGIKTPCDVKQFDLISLTATDTLISNVHGGWWDAGDYDRRSYHFEVVDQLLGTYFLFPKNFTDSQLNIPESGNNIPDIIDEAAWGVDVWRRAQNAQGGVGCWIEATQHPSLEYENPSTDPTRFYLATPTRESTLEYAIYAAKLARAYKQVGALEKSNLFKESALKAWAFALDYKNHCQLQFTLGDDTILYYSEPETLPLHNIYKAALNLSKLTQASEFDVYLSKDYADAALLYIAEKNKPYFLSELIETINFNTETQAYKKHIRTRADNFLDNQKTVAYRHVNYPLDHAFFLTLGWGNAIPTRHSAYFTLAWAFSGEKKYRSAAFLAVDWVLGCNPQGRSMTTGLGKVYPVRILSHPNYYTNQRFADPIPGLTIYTYTARITTNAFKMLYQIETASRLDHNFIGFAYPLLPSSVFNNNVTNKTDIVEAVNRTLPIFRRFANLESYAVDQNEFTVWETMAPAAALYGSFLPEKWQPPANWHQKKPVQSIKKLEGYIVLP